MPMRVDDPEFRAKLEDLKEAGYRYDHQEDARIRWLELEIVRLKGRIVRLDDCIEELEDRLEAKADRQPKLDL